MMGRVIAALGLLGTVACSAGTPVERAEPVQPAASAKAASPADVTYLIFAPQAYADELAPLIKHRTAMGQTVELRDSDEIQRTFPTAFRPAIQHEIEERAALPGSKLHFVLLAGDPQADLPTFMRDASPWASSLGRPDEYPSDYDYVEKAKVPIAIGRLPARNEREMALLVDKTIRYETEEKAGPWQRRTLIFGGPAEMGPLVDGLIESQATSLLDQLLPYDYDVNVLFAKKDSPYARSTVARSSPSTRGTASSEASTTRTSAVRATRSAASRISSTSTSTTGHRCSSRSLASPATTASRASARSRRRCCFARTARSRSSRRAA
jgi:hypothetical protein